MAEENASTTEVEGAEKPTVEQLQEQLKAMTEERDKVLAESRKWEERSKANREKARKYDELAAQSMTDAEKLEAARKKADEAEARLAEYEAEAKRARDAAEVAEKTGVPASLITETDRKAMERQAEAIKAYASGQPTAPVFKGDGQQAGGGDSKGSKQAHFADFFNQISK